MSSSPSRRERSLLIRAWLEERELRGLDPEFRAVLSVVESDERYSAASIGELHSLVDDALEAGGLIFDRPRGGE